MEDWSYVNSDHGLEAINPNFDLVTFENVQSIYEAGQDIFLLYQLGQNFQPHSHDWVGLYRSGWQSLNDYVTYEWAPKYARDERFAQMRSVLFKAGNIQATEFEQNFQFLYVCDGNRVVGVSPAFVFTQDAQLTQNLLLEQAIDDFASLVYVDVGDQTDSAIEVASSSSPPLSLQSFDYCEDSPSVARKGVLVALDDDENEDVSESPKECSAEDRNMAVVAYDHNKRAVVPYRTDDLSIVPYVASTPLQRFCIPTTTKPSENPTENSPELFLRQFLEDFILTRLIPRQLKVMSGAICLQCVHLDNQLRMTANEVKNKVNTNKELEAKINSTENKLILKEVLVDELSKHLRDSIAENSKLVAANERKMVSCRGKQITALRKENDRLKSRVSDSTFRLSRLVAENKILTHRKTQLERRVRGADTKCERMRTKAESAQHKLASLETERRHQDAQMDDIMYTLALHGFSQMVNTDGSTIKLDGRSGQIFRLDGWHIAQSKRSAKQMAMIASQNMMNSGLRDQLKAINKSLADRQHQVALLSSRLQDEVTNSSNLNLQLNTAKKQLYCANAQMETVNSKLIVVMQQQEILQLNLAEEREKYSKLQENKMKEERKMRQRIESLQKSLHTLNNIHKKCDKQKKSISMTGQAIQVSRTTSDTASLTDEVICSPPNPFSMTRGASKESVLTSRHQAIPITNKGSHSKVLNNLEKSESHDDLEDVHPKLLNLSGSSTYIQNKIADHVTYIRKAWEKVSPMANNVVNGLCSKDSSNTSLDSLDFSDTNDCGAAAAATALLPSSEKTSKQHRVKSRDARPKAVEMTCFSFVDETTKPKSTPIKKRPYQRDPLSVEEDQDDSKLSRRQKEQKMSDPSIVKIGKVSSLQSDQAVPKQHGAKSGAPRPFHVIRRNPGSRDAPGKAVSSRGERSQRVKQHKQPLYKQ